MPWLQAPPIGKLLFPSQCSASRNPYSEDHFLLYGYLVHSNKLSLVDENLEYFRSIMSSQQ